MTKENVTINLQKKNFQIYKKKLNMDVSFNKTIM